MTAYYDKSKKYFITPDLCQNHLCKCNYDSHFKPPILLGSVCKAYKDCPEGTVKEVCDGVNVDPEESGECRCVPNYP